jgi:hypothetical protein
VAAGWRVAVGVPDGGDRAAEPGQVRAALAAAGVEAEVTVTRATLEEAFVLLARGVPA